MPFSAGTRFGAFEILSPLGAGGMGEVYRARDPRLNRDVALKVLPEAFTADPERLARFTREAQMLAALNHSNIGAIHGLEDASGRQALVLELVEGPTLADRIAQGALPLEEALPIARQIADALEAAHEQNIIHRDLKPANIKLRPDGTVKVLDFGLAKALDRQEGHASGASRPDVTASPTLLSPATMTSAGIILGTAAYMAPEQARGKAVDRRADIWAFGCVLYEMLAGRRAFEGDEVTDTLASILRGEPSWSALPASTPRSIQRLVQRCLQKDPRQRLQAIGDARLEIADALTGGGRDDVLVAPVPARPRSALVPVAIACAVTAALTGALLWALRPASDEVGPPVTRALIASEAFEHRPPAKAGESRPPIAHVDRTAIALSPDGRTLAYRGIAVNVNPGGGVQSVLFVRRLDTLTATPIAATTGAEVPFFSPDGSWIGYWDGGELRRVPVDGSATYTTIAKVPEGDRILGASWGDGDVVVFATFDGLWRVPASGGMPELFSKVGPEESVRSLPHVLPGGQTVLFTLQKTPFRWDDAQIVASSLTTGAEKVLLSDAADARFVPGGHLMFARRGRLMAVPFDPERLELRGGAVTVADNLMQAVNMGNSFRDSGAGQFAVAGQGSTLVYATGGVAPDSEREIVWVDRTGQMQSAGVPGRTFNAPRLSPEGQRIATWASAPGASGNRVWIYDLLRGTLTSLTPDKEWAYWSVWSPDGSQVAFQVLTAGRGNLHSRSADGTGSSRPLVNAKRAFQAPSSWLPDGTLAYTENGDTTRSDIWILNAASTAATPRPVVQTAANERYPELSADGKWLAYTSDESGRDEVYVQPYPGPGSRVLVSTSGGFAPAWRRDGREIYYTLGIDGTTRMMAVPISVGDGKLTVGPAQRLFEGRFGSSGPSRGYDVTDDGRRFLMVRLVDSPPPPPSQMVLVANFAEELKRLAPAGGSTR